MLCDVESNKAIVLAQFTDCHLFSSTAGLHHGHNVFNNLKAVLNNIKQNNSIDFLVFTGDLTQDHTEQSYQHFVHLVHDCEIELPIYYVAGNHDDPLLLAKYFSKPPFVSEASIDSTHWQVQFIESKSNNPSGYISKQALTRLSGAVVQNKKQLLMMHHHPIDVGYFIDKHGLENKTDFWQIVHQYNNMAGIACGHVHGAMTLNNGSVPLYTCPATSMQFDPAVDGVGALDDGPGYRLFYLYDDGELKTEVIQL